MSKGSGAPLDGVRILAIEQFGAGPFGTLFLADMGAEIIKIEDPAAGGDVGRYVPPVQQGRDSLYFEGFNRGKRSIALDLQNGSGRKIFDDLVSRSHGVFTNLRGDLPSSFGLTYERLGRINPAIVCVSLSAYGRTGERSSWPGYDALIQAEAGWASLTGDPDGPPTKSGLSLVDYGAGLMAALALMIGIFDAARTGRGRDLDTSLYDAALAMIAYPATWFLSAGIVSQRQPMSAHPSIVPFQFFATADGYLAVACAKDKFVSGLFAVLDRNLAADPRFSSFEARLKNRGALLSVLADKFREQTTGEWMRRLGGRVPVAPVRPMSEALNDTELRERGMLASYEHSTLASVRSIGTPFKLSDFDPQYKAAPAYDADRAAILAELGLDSVAIQALEEDGAFGTERLTPKQVQPVTQEGSMLLEHIGITVSDLDASVRFYSILFDSEPVARASWRGKDAEYVAHMMGQPGLTMEAAFFRIPGSNAILEMVQFFGIREGKGVQVRHYQTSGTHIGFYVDDIEAATKRIEQAGARLLAEPSTIQFGPYLGRGGRAVLFRDPDGINLQLMEITGRPGGLPIPVPDDSSVLR
ncbi:MAG TPA: CoA transferase [Candidatus Dormibacteraeota bacterium]